MQNYKILPLMETKCQNICANESIFNEMFKLYVNSFPVDERRTFEKLQYICNNDDKFHIIGLFIDNSFVGFISYWRFDNFVYVEHLATEPNYRNQGLGKTLMLHLKSIVQGETIVLEVEPDVDELTSRRIKFYERLGYVLHRNFEYIQPPYSESQQPLQLLLMTCGNNFVDEQRLDAIAQTIKKEVYYKYY